MSSARFAGENRSPHITQIRVYVTIVYTIVFIFCSQQASNDNSTMEYRQTIQTYYRSYKEADRETLRSLLIDKFRHISPFSKFDDPDEILSRLFNIVHRVIKNEQFLNLGLLCRA